MKKNVKTLLILFVLFTLYIFVSAYSYVSAISNDLSNSVFRLHIIANSDSEEDQNLKYIVRDSLINYMNNLSSSAKNKDEIIEISKDHIEDFKQIAENTIKEQGYSYPVDVEIGNFAFPTKTYGDISFPAGSYDALRVKIGQSSGQNWWCVMFPPLCFINPSTGIVSEESKETLQENLSKEEYSIVSDSNNTSYSFKFKIIEFFQKTGLFTAKR